jgi:hypothetical protein
LHNDMSRCLLLIVLIAATVHRRQPKEDDREDTERKVELAAIFNARCSGSHTEATKSVYLFYIEHTVYSRI